MSYSLTYYGGIAEIKKQGNVKVSVSSKDVQVSDGMFKKAIIPFTDITSVSMKTDEQLSKDVTITRLLALGIFAFGAKKKSKNITNNLVIEYSYGGIQATAVFGGNAVPAVNSEILKRRTKYVKKNQAPTATTAIAEPASEPVDKASEIAKYKSLLDDGAITQEEFNAKKKQLLGI